LDYRPWRMGGAWPKPSEIRRTPHGLRRAGGGAFPLRALGAASVSDRVKPPPATFYFSACRMKRSWRDCFSENRAFPAPPFGQVIVDCTRRRSPAAGFAAKLEAAGVSYLDAPVSGMEQKALNGTLAIMCGGREETFRAVKPLLDCMGRTSSTWAVPAAASLPRPSTTACTTSTAPPCARCLPRGKVRPRSGADRAGDQRAGQAEVRLEYFGPSILSRDFA
jgi:hypothetical protein